jgi:hypothetical protein
MVSNNSNKATIRDDKDRARVVVILNGLSLDKPWDITWRTHAEKRSDAQNRLQQEWNKIISDSVEDMRFEDVRAFNKLHFGVPILRRDNEDFCEEYDLMFRPLPYKQKLHIIKLFDVAITRLMTVKQKTEYLDVMAQYWADQGVYLPHPDDQGR